MHCSSRLDVRRYLRPKAIPWMAVSTAASLLLSLGLPSFSYADEPNCHANANAAQDMQTVLNRGDVKNLPQKLKTRLAEIAGDPHTYLPLQAFAEADSPSQLFQYYLLDTSGFEPNVFTAVIPGLLRREPMWSRTSSLARGIHRPIG